jgi:hypothetical protein
MRKNMVLRKILWISTLVVLTLSACSMNTQLPATQEVPSSPEDILPPEVMAGIKNQISEVLGISLDQIQIETVERKEWPDSCLGLGGPEESCAQVMTPGWLVVFSVDGQEYRFRADETGTTIRQEP